VQKLEIQTSTSRRTYLNISKTDLLKLQDRLTTVVKVGTKIVELQRLFWYANRNTYLSIMRLKIANIMSINMKSQVKIVLWTKVGLISP